MFPTRLPAATRNALASFLGHRPRVLAWAVTEDGELFALLDRLVIRDADGFSEVPWHDILSGGFGESAMHWTRMSTGDKVHIALVEPNSFPEVFKERVEATFLFQQSVYPKPGQIVVISARRNLLDTTKPVLWTAHPGRGVKMDDPETREFVETELARLRAEYAF